MPRRCLTLLSACLVMSTSLGRADPPDAKYIFPAGGRRGTTVPVRIGGCNFHDRAAFHLLEPGMRAAAVIERTKTQWFEGPVIPLPASQAKEDYPLDYANTLEIAADAEVGPHWWKVSTSQGVTSSLPFIVGNLPEIVEAELPGTPAPVTVTLPLTINGRIFPREDVDQWRFSLTAGQTVTCAVDALRLGSPLEARLELRDPNGRKLTECLSVRDQEARLQFTAPEAGDYTVQIHDIQFGGLQHYVYRLTITTGPWIEHAYPLGGRRGSDLVVELAGTNLPANQTILKIPATAASMSYESVAEGVSSNTVTFETDDFPEVLEPADASQPVRFPAVLNGRIARAGEVDEWPFDARKGDELDFEVRAARLGSPLDSVLQIVDARQAVIAENDDLVNGQSDSQLRFQAPADGRYVVRIADRLPDRGDLRYAYRLRVTAAATPDLQLFIPTDAVALERGKPAAMKLTALRGPGIVEEIALQFEDLPSGVTVTPAAIGANQKEVNLTFQAAETTRIQCVPVQVTGRLKHHGETVIRTAGASTGGQRLPPGFWIAVAIPTPFRFAGVFETKYMSRGSLYTRHYTIQRNGFAGSLEARLADQQGRHLQGVTGLPVPISPDQNEFDFTVSLPPWMEIGRTSRTTLSVAGTVTDSDGTRHVVSYSSNAQNDQMIALVDPGRMAITLDRSTVPVKPANRAAIPFRLQRNNGLTQQTTVELIVPEGLKGVSAEQVIVTAADERGQLELEFAPEATGPFLAPVVIRATTVDERQRPVINEARLELVSPQAELP